MKLIRRVSFTEFKTFEVETNLNFQKVIDLKTKKVSLVKCSKHWPNLAPLTSTQIKWKYCCSSVSVFFFGLTLAQDNLPLMCYTMHLKLSVLSNLMTNTVRIIDHLGLFPETRGKARYITVKTYAHAMEIVDEQNKLGNTATLVFW